MQVHVLGNPAARGDTGDTERVVDRLRADHHEAVLIEATSAEASEDAAKDAVAAGAERLLAVGGDGLVRIALRAVAETDVVLGLVPQGTGNDFARALGLLEGTLSDHVARALDPGVPVDAMRTNHGWVASVATMGFAGDVTARANGLRWPRGGQRYTAATLLQLPRLRQIPATVTVDGVEHDADTTMLSVGNTGYFGGGMHICPGVGPHDGRLQVVVIGAVGRGTFLRVFPRVFGGGHLARPEVDAYLGRSVTVSSTEDVMMWADGDELGPLPVTCEAVPGAVRVAGAPT
ncbi:MAG: diacylglycerol kinase family protein [Acidimicrobiales bacterium]|nr:diacylglycerol kinase family protein [Acidimicrobiales bacterium]